MGKNIVLVGLMGAGKTTVGELLAKMYGLVFVDIDKVIELDAGMSISKIFAAKGEEYFRKLESTMILTFSNKSDSIISTGGGAVENGENLKNLKKNGIIVYLKASPEKLFERIKGENNRPLLKNTDPIETLKNLLNKREKNYLKADIIIETDNKTKEEIAEEIGVLCKL